MTVYHKTSKLYPKLLQDCSTKPKDELGGFCEKDYALAYNTRLGHEFSQEELEIAIEQCFAINTVAGWLRNNKIGAVWNGNEVTFGGEP